MSVKKPSNEEEEYFAKEEANRLHALATERKRQTEAAEAQKLKALHFMHCPKCGMKMQEVRYGKLDVDACFSCGGVFLDKGEIDVIAAPQQKGIMGAILNWFKDETKKPV